MSAFGKNEAGGESLMDNPRLFVYVIGGLSHHEICSIAELQQKMNAQIVPGTNQIVTPTEFLDQLEKIHKIDIKKMKAGDTGENEEFAAALGFGTSQSMTNLSDNEDEIQEEIDDF